MFDGVLIKEALPYVSQPYVSSLADSEGVPHSHTHVGGPVYGVPTRSNYIICIHSNLFSIYSNYFVYILIILYIYLLLCIYSNYVALMQIKAVTPQEYVYMLIRIMTS
jgi:hypothetical protein